MIPSQSGAAYEVCICKLPGFCGLRIFKDPGHVTLSEELVNWVIIRRSLVCYGLRTQSCFHERKALESQRLWFVDSRRKPSTVTWGVQLHKVHRLNHGIPYKLAIFPRCFMVFADASSFAHSSLRSEFILPLSNVPVVLLLPNVFHNGKYFPFLNGTGIRKGHLILGRSDDHAYL